MAAHNFSTKQFTLERDVVTLYCRGVGAATSSLTGVKGKGLTSITRTGVGAHTITFDAKYNGLLFAVFSIIDTGTVDDWEVTLVEDLTTSNELKIAIFKGGTAADLATTGTLLGKFDLSNTAQLPKGY